MSRRCLVIEDDVSTSRYVCNGLRQVGYEVLACHDAQKGEQEALATHWDIIILDRMLPGSVDGLALLEQWRGRSIPVLVLSALSSTEERVRGLRAGADDYLIKPFAMMELLARVEGLLRRQTKHSGSLLRVANLTLDVIHQQVERDGIKIALQPREFRLLEYLMRHEHQLVTRSMLLEAVWEYQFDPQTNVIDVQISRLRSKVDKGFSPALIHTVRGAGYRLSAHAEGEWG